MKISSKYCNIHPRQVFLVHVVVYHLQLTPLIKVLHNLVNYKSFGFTKIVPRVPEVKFAAVVEKSANAANAIPLWNEVSSYMCIGIRS